MKVMKALFFFSVAVFMFLGASAQENDQAIKIATEYANKVIAEKEKITLKNIEFLIELVHGKDEAMLETKRMEVLKQANDTYNTFDKMYSHAGDTKVKTAALKMLGAYKQTFSKDYKDAFELKKSNEASFDNMKNYLKKIEIADNKIYQEEMDFRNTFRAFCTEYKTNQITCRADLDILLDEIAAVNAYNRKIYLSYFRIVKLNADFIEAINKKSYNRAMVTLDSLKSGINQEKAIVADIGYYKEDKALYSSTNKLFDYYLGLTEKDFKTLVDLLKSFSNWTPKNHEKFMGIIKKYQKTSQNYHAGFLEETAKLLLSHVPKKI